jgi:hypothetical protein
MKHILYNVNANIKYMNESVQYFLNIIAIIAIAITITESAIRAAIPFDLMYLLK